MLVPFCVKEICPVHRDDEKREKHHKHAKEFALPIGYGSHSQAEKLAGDVDIVATIVIGEGFRVRRVLKGKY